MATITTPEDLNTLPIGAVFTDAEEDTARKIDTDAYLVTGVGAAVTSRFFAFPVKIRD
ncbi:hypothetical protein [Streptomyces venezuelae]|uniref:hypothetical protein n=1 Tax=Streptomyces venezuelae TaxID=54571 RepID=UPI003787DB08